MGASHTHTLQPFQLGPSTCRVTAPLIKDMPQRRPYMSDLAPKHLQHQLLPLTYSASARWASGFSLEYARDAPTSGPLHLLYPLPGTLCSFPRAAIRTNRVA